MMAMANGQNERHFKSKGHIETTTLKWDVQDFLNLTKADARLLKCNTLEFDAGHTIGIPSRWRVQLKIKNKMLQLHLKLLKCSTTPILAHFQWCIKNQNGDTFEKETAQMETYDNNCQFRVGTSAQSEFSYWPFVKLLSEFPAIFNDGSLKIEISFWLSIDTSFKTEEIVTVAAAKKNECRLAVGDDFQRLLDSGENADIVIKVKDEKGRMLKAHKGILTARSPVFLAMFQNKMKEASSGVVSIENVSYEAMGILLKFIYSGAVDEKWVDFAEEIVDAAEKYSLGQLKEFCDHFLARACSNENCMDLLKLSRLYNLKVAEEKILAFISANIREIL